MSTDIKHREKTLHTEELTINMGPQHPSTHGVLRVILRVDGEFIVDVSPDIGYLHRGVEKLFEERTYIQNIPLTDRLDYLAAMFNNLAYVLAVEKLAGIEVTERAEYIRVIAMELNRIASHLVFWGTFGLDVGALTPVLYAFREREKIIALLEMLSGARMTFNFIRFGGVKADLPDGFIEKLSFLLADLPQKFDEYEQLLSGNEIFLVRTKGIGKISTAQAVNLCITGPSLRATGYAFDLRRVNPYSIYDRFEFEISTGKNGDTFDRYKVRIEEMRQSVKILEQAIKQLPEGEIVSKVPKVLKVPAGDFYAKIESPRGELGVYIVSDGTTNPYRVHFRAPSFINLQMLKNLAVGMKIGDLVAILGSLDIVLGEIDR